MIEMSHILLELQLDNAVLNSEPITLEGPELEQFVYARCGEIFIILTRGHWSSYTDELILLRVKTLQIAYVLIDSDKIIPKYFKML